MIEKTGIYITIPKELLERVKKQADKDLRSRQSYILKVLNDNTPSD